MMSYEQLRLMDCAAMLPFAGATIAAVKAQLRHPLQVVAQSKMNMEQMQASTNGKLEGLQKEQADRDGEHLSKHAQSVEVCAISDRLLIICKSGDR